MGKKYLWPRFFGTTLTLLALAVAICIGPAHAAGIDQAWQNNQALQTPTSSAIDWGNATSLSENLKSMNFADVTNDGMTAEVKWVIQHRIADNEGITEATGARSLVNQQAVHDTYTKPGADAATNAQIAIAATRGHRVTAEDTRVSTMLTTEAMMTAKSTSAANTTNERGVHLRI